MKNFINSNRSNDAFLLKKSQSIMNLLLILIFLSVSVHAQITQTFTSIGFNTFTVPAGVTSLNVECWGGGGAGGGCTAALFATGGGGAGGSYTRAESVAVVPCSTYTITVGAGGAAASARAGGKGGTSSFGTIVTAVGGLGGGVNGVNLNGAGADATIGITYNGGAGGTGTAVSGTPGASGGGGGGAGSTGNGGNAVGVNAGSGGNGGAGASGRSTNGAGYSGSAPGGGGSGGRNGSTAAAQLGGSGGRGQVSVTYNCPNYAISGINVTNVCSGSSSQISLISNATDLPPGYYTATYNLSAPNAVTGATATFSVNSSGTGSFLTTALLNAGITTITITNIKSGSSGGCSSLITANSSANISVTATPSPVAEFTPGLLDTVSNISVCGFIGDGLQNDMDIESGNPGGASVIQWQYSLNGTTWTNAPGPTASSSQYVLNPVYCSFGTQPGTYYFRVLISNSYCNGISNRIKLIVSGSSDLFPGIIGDNQQYCQSGDPFEINVLSAPTGGSGSYTYQWQSSTDSINFNLINGATSATYNPGILSQTTYYRRITISGGCRAFSNIVRVKITTSVPASAGTINGLTSVCAGSTGLIYSVIPNPDALLYNWTLSENMTLLSGSDSNSITVSADHVQSGTTVSVSVTNACGVGPSTVLPITVNSVSTESILLGDTSICAGSSASLKVNITGGTAPYTIALTDGNTVSSFTGYNSGSPISVQPSGNCTYTLVSVTSVSGCSGTELTGEANILVTESGTWLGKVDNNWNNPANWCGGVPDSSRNVVIPVGSLNTPIIITQPAKVRNLNVLNGSGINLNGQIITVFGSIQGNGNINAQNGSIVLAGNDSIQTVKGSYFLRRCVKNLKISNTNGVTIAGVGDTLILTGKLEFGNSNCILYTNGNLTISSSDSATASVADMTAEGIYSGNRILGDVTVERYIPLQSKAWRFLSVPAIGRSIKANWQENNNPLSNTNQPGYGTIITSNLPGAVTSLGFDIYTPSGTTLKTYNSSNNTWTGVSSTLNNINNVNGYMIFIRGDRSVTAYNQPSTATKLRTSGTLYTDTDNPPPSIMVNADKFETAGNPYASAIDFAKLSKSGGIQDVFYLWDPALTSLTNSSYGLGGFQTFIRNGNTYDIIPGGGSYSMGYTGIPSGQAFFVRSVTTGGVLGFTEYCKNVTNYSSRNSNDDQQSLKVNMSVLNNGNTVLLDGVKAYFNDEFSDDVDDQDVLKMGNNISENISWFRNGNQLAGDRRSPINDQDTLFFRLNQMKRSTYRLDFDFVNFNASLWTATMVDKYLDVNTTLRLDSTQTFFFTIDSNQLSFATDRFYLLFNRITTTIPVTLTIGGIREHGGGVRIDMDSRISENGKLVLEKSSDNINFSEVASFNEYNNKGTSQLRTHKATFDERNWEVYYRSRFTSFLTGKSYTSNILKFNNYSNESFSNEAQFIGDRSVFLRLKNPEKGNYTVKLFSSGGQLLENKKIAASMNEKNIRIDFSSMLAHGVYVIAIERGGVKIWTGMITHQ